MAYRDDTAADYRQSLLRVAGLFAVHVWIGFCTFQGSSNSCHRGLTVFLGSLIRSRLLHSYDF